MSDERSEKASFKRRRLLTGLGTVGVTSLAGCVQPLFEDDETETPSSIEQVQLAKLPDDYDYGENRIIVPSKDVVDTFQLRHQQQVRITRPGKTFEGDFLSALFTTRQNVDFNTDTKKTIWMSEDAFERINANAGWYVNMTPYAPHPEFDSDEEAKQNDEYVEQSIDASGNELIAASPYGGDMYSLTDTQALRVASELQESAWVCHGYNTGGGALDRWYISPTLLHPRSFPELSELVSYDGDTDEDEQHEYDNEYDYAVLFTGTEKRGVYIGGLVEDEIKNRVRKAVSEQLNNAGRGDIPVSITRTGNLAGTDTKNIANRLSDDGHQGVQIAQGKNVRENYWKEVSDGVISAFKDL